MPSITVSTLSNGMRLHRIAVDGTRALTLLVAFDAGARTEHADENGMAHFLEHLVFKGGENSIVVYAIDQTTGEPTPIQHVETQKIHPRTFHIHPSGKLMVAEHNLPVNVRDGDSVKTVAAGLSVFRIGDDGKLTFARTYDIDVGDKLMFWMGMVTLPASA